MTGRSKFDQRAAKKSRSLAPRHPVDHDVNREEGKSPEHGIAAAVPAETTTRESVASEDSAWSSVAAFVPGGGHLARGIPCQDRADAWTDPRPALLLLDGRGSAPLSHEGADAALRALRHEIGSLEDRIRAVLDEDPDESLASLAWQGLARWLYTVAARVQRNLADASGRTPADFEFTLSLAVVGTRRVGWLAVGDSPIVAARHGILFLPSILETAEFANQTSFVQVDPGPRPGLRGGLFPAKGLDLIAAMSDGASTRLIDLRGQVAAEAVNALGSLLATGELDQSVIKMMLEEAEWDDVTRDDRSVAMLARRGGVEPCDCHATMVFPEQTECQTPEHQNRPIASSACESASEIQPRLAPWIRIVSLQLLFLLLMPLIVLVIRILAA